MAAPAQNIPISASTTGSPSSEAPVRSNGPKPKRVGLSALMVSIALPTIPLLLPGPEVGYAGWNLRFKALTDDKPRLSSLPTPAAESLESVLKVELLAAEVKALATRLLGKDPVALSARGATE